LRSNLKFYHLLFIAYQKELLLRQRLFLSVSNLISLRMGWIKRVFLFHSESLKELEKLYLIQSEGIA